MEGAYFVEGDGEDVAIGRADLEDGAFDGHGEVALGGRRGSAAEKRDDRSDGDAVAAFGDDAEPAIKEGGVWLLGRGGVGVGDLLREGGEGGEHFAEDVLPEEVAHGNDLFGAERRAGRRSG